MRYARVSPVDAEEDPSELVQKAMLGEEVIIAKDNKPLLKLVPLQPRAAKHRKPGLAEGKVWMASDFDATPQDLEDYS